MVERWIKTERESLGLGSGSGSRHNSRLLRQIEYF